MYHDDLSQEVRRLHKEIRALQQNVKSLESRQEDLEQKIKHQGETIIVLAIFVGLMVMLVTIAYPVSVLFF